MIIAIILMAIAALVIGYFLYERIKKYSVKATIIKSIASLLFLSVAAVSFIYKGYHILTVFVILGGLLGLLGDIWLELKCVYPSDDKIYTYAGFTAFGLGHVLYVVGMFLEFYHDGNALNFIIPVLVGIIFAFIVLLMEKPLKLQYGKLKWIVFIYSVLLALNASSCMSLLILNQFEPAGLIVLFAGGVFFILSDLILSGTYFGIGKDRPIDFILNISIYYISQFLIAFSLFFI